MIEFVPIESLRSGQPKGRDFSWALERIKRIQRVFADVHPQTVEEWIDGFDRDAHPEREIALWSIMADVFELASPTLPREKDKEILATLLLYTSGAHSIEQLREYALQSGRPIDLDDTQLQLVLDTWKRASSTTTA